MSEEQTNKKSIIYQHEGTQYNVSKFSDEGKLAFGYVVDVNQEINSLNKRADILQAAAVALSSKINSQLTADMQVTEVIGAEEGTLSEAVADWEKSKPV
tara:strand:- start:10822 stop:11118 length:297 start_codon:yes stop_codon:yes gene_type:complete